MAIEKKKISPKTQESVELSKAARGASSRAIRIARALELPVQYIEDGKLLERSANGTVALIKDIEKVRSKIQLKKGTPICLGRKG